MVQVTWVAMIICILFFEMNLAMALWTGLIVGLAYTGFARAMYRTQLAAIQREVRALLHLMMRHRVPVFVHAFRTAARQLPACLASMRCSGCTSLLVLQKARLTPNSRDAVFAIPQGVVPLQLHDVPLACTFQLIIAQEA